MALRGIKVLELAGLAPAPFCGMLLADFGANVINIDRVGGETADIDCLRNGKQSMVLNLKHEEGRNIFRKLIKKSDVLIEPYRKGVMEFLGLGPDVLLKDNPKLIYARLTGFGQSGSYCNRAGHDMNYIAVSGLLSLFGRYNQKPIFPANIVADFGGGGLMCAFGILLALHERSVSGLGQVVDNGMVQGSAYLGSWFYRSRHLPIWGERGKSFLDSGAHFYEVYETKDGKYMSVAAVEPQFYANLLIGLGIEYEEAPQFVNFEESKQLFAATFIKKTQAEWCGIFDKVDACVMPVLTLKEAPHHEHNVKQDTFVKCADGDDYAPTPAPKLSRTPGVSKSTIKAPQKGQHTRSILRELNYSDNDISKLEQDGVVEVYKQSKL